MTVSPQKSSINLKTSDKHESYIHTLQYIVQPTPTSQQNTNSTRHSQYCRHTNTEKTPHKTLPAYTIPIPLKTQKINPQLPITCQARIKFQYLVSPRALELPRKHERLSECCGIPLKES